MRTSAPSRRLAGAAHARQLLAHRRAEAAAGAAGDAVLAIWRQLLALLRQPGTLAHAHRRARDLLAGIVPAVQRQTAANLARTAAWGYRTATATVLRTVPRRLLAAAALRRARPLREDEGDPEPAFALDWLDLLGPLRGTTPADDPLALFASLLFPPPDASLLNRVVFGSNWTQRLAAGTSLAAPSLLANLIVQGLSQGLSQQEIARQLLPHVQGVQASARRIARTESMRVAGAMQLRCHEQLGDMVIGYQIHATLDRWTRPWHRQRDGTIYYQHPGPGQKGYHQLPHPPDEAADPAERPPGTPHTAWNCRCFLTPVLSDPD